MKKIISIFLVLTLISSLFPLGILASESTNTNGVTKTVYKVLECEDNGVENWYGGNNIAPSMTVSNSAASGGKYVYTNIIELTWKFTPEKSGVHMFEIAACGDIQSTNNKFYVNNASAFTGAIKTTGVNSASQVLKTELGRYNLSANTEYTLKIVFDEGTAVGFDYFNVYYEQAYNAEHGTTTTLSSAYNDKGTAVTGEANAGALLGAVYTIYDGGNVRVPVTIEEQGLYSVSVRGIANTDVNARVRIDEIINKDKATQGSVTVTPHPFAIGAEQNTLVYTEDIALFYMTAGEKILSLIINGGAYTCDYISISKIEASNFIDYEYLEAEDYEKSDDIYCTQAFSGVYDSASNKRHGGMRGSNLDLEYKLYIPADGTYKIKTIGAATSDASVVTIAIDADYEPISASISAGDYTSAQTQLGQVELAAGYHTFKLTCDNEVILDAFIFEKEQALTRETIVNAETDFDRHAGHNVGWYDTTPNGYDDIYQVRDTYGYVDVCAGVNYYANNVGQAVAYMIGGEWFRYTVEVPYSGYYRLLLGVKTVSLQTDGTQSKFTVTVNGNDITKTIPQRTDNWTSNPLPWDDFGLVYLDAGANTIKVKFDNSTGNAQFDAFKLVYPDMSLYSVIDGGTATIEAEDYIETTASYKYNEFVVATPGEYLTIEYDAPKTGAYKITAITNGDKATDTAKPRVQIYVDGTSVGTFEVATSGFWDPVATPLETVISEINLTAGERKIKFETREGFSIGYEKFTFDIPDAETEATTLSAGQYKVVADLNDWYAGYTKTDGGAKINWTSDGYIDTLAVIAAVYDGTEVKSTVVTNAVNSKNEAVLNGINVEEGNTIKVFIWDSYNVKPLTDYVIYE